MEMEQEGEKGGKGRGQATKYFGLEPPLIITGQVLTGRHGTPPPVTTRLPPSPSLTGTC